jgi:hypothetical protein
MALRVDQQPVDWRALTATPDSAARLNGAILGDRDRIELALPPGPHNVGVELLAGHANQVLVRVRQPEERED